MAHKHHPVVLWISEHPNNFITAIKLGLNLCHQNIVRRGKQHACHKLLALMRHHVPATGFLPTPYKDTCIRATRSIPSGCTSVPLCMPEKYHVKIDGEYDLIASYRAYYCAEKMRFANGKLATFYPTVPKIFIDAYLAA